MSHKFSVFYPRKYKFDALVDLGSDSNIKMADNNKQKKSFLSYEISLGSIDASQKAVLAKQLAVTIEAGLPILESLGISRDSSQGRMKKILTEIMESVSTGHTLADSFARQPKYFSRLFVNSVYAGEESGTLAEAFRGLAIQMTKEKELLGKIRGALVYPVFVLITAIILGMSISLFVLPKITPLFEGLNVTLPATTRAIIWFSHFVENYGYYLFPGIIVGIIFLFWLWKQKFAKPFTDILVLNLPVIKHISRGSNTVQFCRALATLLKSGLNVTQSLEVAHDSVTNFYYRRALRSVATRVGKGTSINENLEQHSWLFPLIVTRMIKVGEESGKLEDTLFYLAEFFDNEVDAATKNLSTSIEPILLLSIGGIVAFLALSIITPIYEITGKIGR